MPALLCPDIPAPTLAAARLEAFNTLRALATNLANAQQARLAALAILSMQVCDSTHVPVGRTSRPPSSSPEARAPSAAGLDARHAPPPRTCSPNVSEGPASPSSATHASAEPSATAGPGAVAARHSRASDTINSPPDLATGAPRLRGDEPTSHATDPATKLLDTALATLPAIPPSAPRTSAETRALISRLDRFLQTPFATPERVQRLLAKSGKG